MLNLSGISNPDEEPQILSHYEKNQFDYVLKSDFFGMVDENENKICINYSDLHKVVPDSWKLFDEIQYKTQSLSDEEWETFWARAKQLDNKKLV